MEILEINLDDAEYPDLLKQITDPPERLFIWGNPEALSANALAIVGSRRPSDYGIRVAAHLSRGLSPYFIIISGLAYGIDTVALQEAVDSGGVVVAVIGSGLDRDSFYPSSNWQLATKIVAAGGVVISEYPEGTLPMKHHFPARNRIIAGLAKGVIVVEAKDRSGALITADLALQFNREVLAVAGSLFTPEAKGPNRMIKEGAQIITSLEDILDTFGVASADSQIQLNLDLTPEERTIINILNGQQAGVSINELTNLAHLDTQKVSSTLTLMEIKGVVKHIGAGKFTCLVN